MTGGSPPSFLLMQLLLLLLLQLLLLLLLLLPSPRAARLSHLPTGCLAAGIAWRGYPLRRGFKHFFPRLEE
jgi:hypothetical protein